ncbi:MAG: NADH-quinone oxidoreductase subunit M [Candidatus Paracaedibacteraceae bacterium]|nr:NADH-quinone oxidoreductase subunit M [Candidatus Paracaedibacteraceae bacterium]
MTIPLLSLLILLPLSGVAFLILVKDTDVRNAKAVALWISSLNLILALTMWSQFDPADLNFQFVEKHSWIESMRCSYHLGVDGISIYFVLLATLLTPMCILSSFDKITHRVREYMISFLLLETFMIGVFCALDAILFYLFFEGVLIPMFLIIGLWGGSSRIYACFKFFLYTFFGSVFMLIALVKLYGDVGTTNFIEMFGAALPLETQQWLFWAFMIGFAVKIPMWPLHTWLPDAHVEAPTAGSVLLAGVLLKMGGYGILRVVLPVLPDAAHQFAPIMITLSLIGIVYASIVALVQTDIKKLIAYSSVAHMGFVTLGIFTFSPQGITGAIVQMISHGFVSAALFFCVGVIYERYHTREISAYGGIASIMPMYATVFFILLLGSIGMPGTSGFIGEFLVLLAAFKIGSIVALIAILGVIFSAAYMLLLYKRVFTGKLTTNISISDRHNLDLTKYETSIFTVLILIILILGIYPKVILKGIDIVVPKLIISNRPVA